MALAMSSCPNLLPGRFKIITCTVDNALGELGIVYAAAGFDFIGTMSMHHGRRALVRIGDKVISERQAYDIAGTRGVRALSKLGFDVSAVPRRARYFAFRGGRLERRWYRRQIAHLIKPYPKR